MPSKQVAHTRTCSGRFLSREGVGGGLKVSQATDGEAQQTGSAGGRAGGRGGRPKEEGNKQHF